MPRSGITTGEAALYLGCSAAAMRVWRNTGAGPRFFRAGRLVRYRFKDLDEWIARHSHPAYPAVGMSGKTAPSEASENKA